MLAQHNLHEELRLTAGRARLPEHGAWLLHCGRRQIRARPASGVCALHRWAVCARAVGLLAALGAARLALALLCQ
jgi:hypothetical protein